MSPAPKIGRRQPSTPDAREQEQHEAALDRERTEADEVYQPQHIEMSDEEKAVLEREKAEELAVMRATRPPKPGPERGAPESLSAHRIMDFSEHAPERQPDVEPVVEEAPTPVKVSDEPAEVRHLDLLEEEIAALEAERTAAVQANAEQLRQIKADTDTKLALIQRKREERERQLVEAKQEQARLELGDRARAAAEEARRNGQRELAGLSEKRATFAQSLQPVVDAAKQALREIAALNRRHGDALRELAGLRGWEDTPNSWPKELRLRMRDKVIFPAREVAQMIEKVLRENDPNTPKGIVRQAEALIASWRPGTPSAEVTMYVSRTNADLVRSIRDQITAINEQFAAIEEEGKVYVASGEVPEVVVMLSENVRQELKAELLYKGAREMRQTRAEGVSDPIV